MKKSILLMSFWTFAVFLVVSGSTVFFEQSASAETAAGWVKYENNPVLGGDLGVCFDISLVQRDGLFQMWFSWRPKKAIAYTESKDGTHWSSPQIVLTPNGDWEQNLNRPGVVFKDGQYHLWYTGQTKKESRIGYAVSSDGIHWKRVQKEPVLVAEKPWEKVAVMCPHVLWDSKIKLFRMWYSGGEQYEPNAIGYATSPDGVTWTKYEKNPVFFADPNTTWEKHKVTASQVFPWKGWFYMFYIGFENEHLARIGIARSKDGLSGWERLRDNPIISPDPDKWDGDACYKPFVLFDQKECKWRLWYNGRKGHVEQIGLAVHEGEDLGFLLDKPVGKPAVLRSDDFRHYIDQFNRDDVESVKQLYPNSVAWDFLSKNAPLFECSDQELEKIWYFRQWTFRKHIKQTAEGGFVITEFHPLVPWAGKENAISCPAGHHFREGRWLHQERILNDYARFWLRGGGALRSYSFWIADSLWQQALVTGDTATAVELLDDLIANYKAWEKDRLDPNGLFWQIDDRDGMEVSIGGSGYRATINTYMYAESVAISKIAALAGKEKIEKEFLKKAERIKSLMNEKLWDAKMNFYKVAPRVKKENAPLQLKDVREEHGYTPWYADEAQIPLQEYTVAWKQLTDPKGFYAPFGPTTAEQRHPGFKISYDGHECQWNGPSWPYSTSITLTGLANLIVRDAAKGRPTGELQKAFLSTLKIYAGSHYRKTGDGRKVCWIDENLNPFTGDWISRTRLESMGWKPRLGGFERGKDYNHSTFCDLIVNGLVGLRPKPDNRFELLPLFANDIKYFCLDNVRYHHHDLTILYDADGQRYHRGKGLRVLVDGKEVAHRDTLPEKPINIVLDK